MQGLFGDLALVGGVQFEELAPRIGHAADLGHTEFKTGLVAGNHRRSACPSSLAGNSYCTNPFWSTCTHRMACIGCDFNLPKASVQGQALESKVSIRRYLEEVPLTADERAIVEGDQAKIEGFIRKLEGVPALDGRTVR
jgi:hypothetical protein